jgi:hypothetical protein
VKILAQIDLNTYLLVFGPLVLGGVSHWLARKIDAIGEHLEKQDKEQARVNYRLQRIEEKLKLRPVPRD